MWGCERLGRVIQHHRVLCSHHTDVVVVKDNSSVCLIIRVGQAVLCKTLSLLFQTAEEVSPA
jgi:hypothetical protein